MLYQIDDSTDAEGAISSVAFGFANTMLGVAKHIAGITVSGWRSGKGRSRWWPATCFGGIESRRHLRFAKPNVWYTAAARLTLTCAEDR